MTKIKQQRVSTEYVASLIDKTVTYSSIIYTHKIEDSKWELFATVLFNNISEPIELILRFKESVQKNTNPIEKIIDLKKIFANNDYTNIEDTILVMVADEYAEFINKERAVSYTHLTLPTSYAV